MIPVLYYDNLEITSGLPKSEDLCSIDFATSTAFFQFDSCRYFSISNSVLIYFDLEMEDIFDHRKQTNFILSEPQCTILFILHFKANKITKLRCRV